MKAHPSAAGHTAVRRGWFPHPVLSALLAASWLALSHSLAVVHLLSALLIGWGVPRLIAPFLGQPTASTGPPPFA